MFGNFAIDKCFICHCMVSWFFTLFVFVFMFIFLVQSGGYLLDYFVVNLAKEKFSKKLRSVQEFLPLSVLERQNLFKFVFPHVKAVFLGWILQQLYNISQSNIRQLFYLTLLAEWRGLSQSGQDVLGKLNMLLPSKSYVRYKKTELARQKHKVQSLLDTSDYVFWVDNFAKQFRKSNLFNKANAPYVKLDYTPFAISVFPPSVGNLAHKFVNGVLLPSFPPRLFYNEFKLCLVQMLHTFDTYDNCRFWHSSTARQQQIFNVPLKFETGLEDENDLLEGSEDGLRYFHTFDLFDANVSSRVGLVKVVNEIRNVFVKQGRYSLCKVDINIFWRLCKVSIFFFLYLFTDMVY